MATHEIAEGEQDIRRGEGVTFTITTTNWESSPAPADISIIRLADSTAVTTDWTSTATPSVAGDIITLPEITPPTDAEAGTYRVNVPFTAGGFSPGIPYFDLVIVA